VELTAPLQQLLVETNRRAVSASALKRNGQPKSLPLTLSEEHRRCLAAIRAVWTSFPVLRLPDWSRPFVLVTDASKQAACSTLMQRHGDDGVLLPIAFFSKAFTAKQAGLAPYETDLLAVYWSLIHFRHYLLNHRHPSLRPIILCDHKPLAHLRTKHKLSQTDSRIVDYLSQFDYTWEYLPGPEMVNLFPDLLSRPYDDGIPYPEGHDRIHPSCDPRSSPNCQQLDSNTYWQLTPTRSLMSYHRKLILPQITLSWSTCFPIWMWINGVN